MIVYKFFDKKSKGGAINSKNILNEQLAEGLHKPLLKIFLKCKVYPSFKENIWGADIEACN